ncbi:pyrroline-5-carboxylate reductase-like [Camellia sinensis]|uniref:pyrroline-5-carboxylate reductase-like n=1 Tax=Camellia sinensis TaxID=4442 RepID=UPI001035C434|nr:pyrroline-5-carboxylate reductase-like [Camellia sinensis]
MLFHGIAVKEVALQLRLLLSEKQLLVSVAEGVKLTDLQEWAGHNRFTRVISNTPAAIGEAASVMSLGAAATEEDGELIAKLFGAIGKIWKADEKLFDAITRLSGSSPAYIYLVIEALADGGVAAVLPREPALGLASQTSQVILDISSHEYDYVSIKIYDFDDLFQIPHCFCCP